MYLRKVFCFLMVGIFGLSILQSIPFPEQIKDNNCHQKFDHLSKAPAVKYIFRIMSDEINLTIQDALRAFNHLNRTDECNLAFNLSIYSIQYVDLFSHHLSYEFLRLNVLKSNAHPPTFLINY